MYFSLSVSYKANVKGIYFNLLFKKKLAGKCGGKVFVCAEPAWALLKAVFEFESYGEPVQSWAHETLDVICLFFKCK